MNDTTGSGSSGNRPTGAPIISLEGVNYTLASITAVVLGGTSLRGGRGTFIGTLMGAVLLTEVLNAVSFLGLSQMWQYLFQGVLILAAALAYSTARNRAQA